MSETKTFTYKEKRNRPNIFVPGYGTSNADGLLITTNPAPLENPNFVLDESTQVGQTQQEKPAVTAQPAQPASPVATPQTNDQSVNPQPKENA